MIAALALGLAVAGFPDSAATPITLAEAVRMAQQNAPSAIAAHGQVRTTSASVRSAYGAFLPSLNLSAGASRQLPAEAGRTRIDTNGNVVILPNDPWSYNVGFSASVPIFEGGRRFFDLRQAKARSSAAQANEVAQSFDVAYSVKQQYYAVLAQREAEAAANAQLEQAKEQRTFSIAKFRAQNATKSDSLRAEIQVRNAENAIADAQNGIATAEAALTRMVGAGHLVTASAEDTLSPPPIVMSDDQLRELADQSPK